MKVLIAWQCVENWHCLLEQAKITVMLLVFHAGSVQVLRNCSLEKVLAFNGLHIYYVITDIRFTGKLTLLTCSLSRPT